MDTHRRKLRALRWKPWALLGMAALAWWYYAAPIHLAKRIRSSVEQPLEPDTLALIAARVDFAQLNARLSRDLHSASGGHLNGDSFSHLLLYGWLPQQRQNIGAAEATDRRVENELIPGSVSARARHTRLHVVRYKDLNRFIAIFWDATEVHEVVLTLRRKSALHHWYVTEVAQFNVCAYDFDCAQISIADLPSMGDAESTKPVRVHAQEAPARRD